MSPCGCGGNRAATQDYVVNLNGQESYRGQTMADARMWIAKNANGKRATVRTAPKKK